MDLKTAQINFISVDQAYKSARNKSYDLNIKLENEATELMIRDETEGTDHTQRIEELYSLMAENNKKLNLARLGDLRREALPLLFNAARDHLKSHAQILNKCDDFQTIDAEVFNNSMIYNNPIYNNPKIKKQLIELCLKVRC